ncbi:hypothetical protein ACT3SZ_15085 [Corynebacterium sp. AOP40-9SA-29]|uniref:hypothetical protein n=1 Tax=Corynebacterium sp. AOP40-9SA-29 TaxID=3457677 RepID=UPI0040344D4D
MDTTLTSLAAMLGDRLTLDRSIATELIIDQVLLLDTMTGSITDPTAIPIDQGNTLIAAAELAYELAGTIALGETATAGTITIAAYDDRH